MLTCIDVAVPSPTSIVSLKDPLPHQAPSNQFETNTLVENAYKDSLHLSNLQKQSRYLNFNLRHDIFEEAILNRRSMREFHGQSITHTYFDTIKAYVEQPIISDCDEEIHIYYVLNRVQDMPLGLYFENKYLKADNFQAHAGYLFLEQALGAQSAITIFLTSKVKIIKRCTKKQGLSGIGFILSVSI